MLRLFVIKFFLIACVFSNAQQRPVTFFTKKEVAEVKMGISKYALLFKSYTQLKNDVDKWVGKDVDVPFPKDPAGGYTHDKHKANYTLMFNSGILYNLTGDAKYATLVKNMMMKYAALNPTLKNHPQATSTSPGRIFWQALNDANWLVYAGLAFDLIHDYLTPAETSMPCEPKGFITGVTLPENPNPFISWRNLSRVLFPSLLFPNWG